MQKIIACSISIIIMGSTITYGQNILNNIFKPSVEGGYLIDAGHSKESVGSVFFEGGIDIDINLAKEKMCHIDNTIIQASQDNNTTTCANKEGERTPYTIQDNNITTQGYRCVRNKTLIINTNEASCTKNGDRSFNKCTIAGRQVAVTNETECNNSSGQWKEVENTIEAKKRAPLMVRVMQLLLRVTITLSVTFILYNAIMYALSMSNDGETSNRQKKLRNIMIGVAIALGSIGIIQLIQSIVNQSIF